MHMAVWAPSLPEMLLWVNGNPGAGKSTLLKYIYETVKQDRDKKSVFASCFFHGRGALIQKSPLDIFRSLLHQLAQQIPELLGWKFKKRKGNSFALSVTHPPTSRFGSLNRLWLHLLLDSWLMDCFKDKEGGESRPRDNFRFVGVGMWFIY